MSTLINNQLSKNLNYKKGQAWNIRRRYK